MTESGFISDAKLRGLERRLRNLVAGISEKLPGVQWKFDVYGTEYFPFRAYASAFRGPMRDGNAELVIALQGQRPGGGGGSRIRFFADLATGDGEILAESPMYEIDLLDGSPDSRSAGAHRGEDGTLPPNLDQRINSIIDILRAWLRHQRPLIEHILSPDRDAEILQRLQLLARLDAHAMQLRWEMKDRPMLSSAQIIRQGRQRRIVAA